ncbi:RICIN domain-containing protein [Streptomyces thermolilacinus]
MLTTFRLSRRKPARRALAGVAALRAALMTGVGAAGTAQAATVDPNAWYALVSRASGKALDVSGADFGNGAATRQWTRADSANQRCRFAGSGSGPYRLMARHSGKVLDVDSHSTADGADIVPWSDPNRTDQYVRQGRDPDAGDDHLGPPWRMGPLDQSNSPR